jgi:hypothetical protein
LRTAGEREREKEDVSCELLREFGMGVISGLLCRRGPVAIGVGIAEAGVDAMQCCAWRSWAHIGEEVGEGEPAVRD